MAGWREVGDLWATLKELDVNSIRAEVERPITLALVGAAGAGKSTLIAAVRHERLRHPADTRPRVRIYSPTIELDLGAAAKLTEADLTFLVLDATRGEFASEAELCAKWRAAGRNVLVFYNKMDAVADAESIRSSAHAWPGVPVAFGSASDPDSLDGEFVPCVIAALPDRQLALARQYPLFRLAVGRALINSTSAANATYSLGTGLAEAVPILDLPFNVADMVVLTKNQALMVYKLGLALGLSTRWQEHAAILGGVVGAGFMWRQAARQLIGLIPVWGIVPKVAIAYAGTWSVGEAVLYWYQTGRKLTGRDMREAYARALSQGRQFAQNLIERAPRPRLRRGGPAARATQGKIQFVCGNCGRTNPTDARFCACCGTAVAKS